MNNTPKINFKQISCEKKFHIDQHIRIGEHQILSERQLTIRECNQIIKISNKLLKINNTALFSSVNVFFIKSINIISLVRY